MPDLDASSRIALDAMLRARDFPGNTCSASRHAALLAEELIRHPGLARSLIEDPQHCGESIALTVASLWMARTGIAELRRLLARYRDETPPGYQPHMIAHEADIALGRVKRAR